MSGSLAIDIAIGLVLTFLLLALLCTIIQEWIAQVFEWRAKNLEAAIIRLLSGRTPEGNPKPPTAEADAVLKHPLYKMLAPGAKSGVTSGKDKPSYMPSTNFALALIDSLKTTRSTDGKIEFASLRKAVDDLTGPNPDLANSLRPILDAAENDLSKAITGVEKWFDSAMDRASGWYKRNVKRWLICLAFIIAVVMNIDAIQIAVKLSSDSELREKIVAYSATIAPQNGTPDAELQKLQKSISTNLANREAVSFGGLPIGWVICSPSSLQACYGMKDADVLGAGIIKIIGLFFTALMASLGSQFWFGILQQLNAIRGTGPKPTPTK